jgi:hypothetical protein
LIESVGEISDYMGDEGAENAEDISRIGEKGDKRKVDDIEPQRPPLPQGDLRTADIPIA